MCACFCLVILRVAKHRQWRRRRPQETQGMGPQELSTKAVGVGRNPALCLNIGPVFLVGPWYYIYRNRRDICPSIFPYRKVKNPVSGTITTEECVLSLSALRADATPPQLLLVWWWWLSVRPFLSLSTLSLSSPRKNREKCCQRERRDAFSLSSSPSSFV